MNKKHSNLLTIVVSVVMVFSMAISVHAIEVVDLNRSGSITAAFCHEGEPASGGTLTMYKVGDVQVENGADFRFVLTDAFAASGIPLDDIESQQVIDNLAAYVQKNALKGKTEVIGGDGVVLFSNAAPGLYLMVQETACDGFYPIDPFLVSLPQGDENGWEYTVDATPKMQTDMETVPDEDNPDEDELPNTGQLKWPVPVLAIAGLAIFALGWVLCFLKGKKDA